MRHQPSNTTSGRAFSLIELLIVIAIMGLLAAMIIPMINPFMRFATGGSTTNTINAAVAAARAFATNGPADLHPIIDNASFSGAAIIFTPSNELRLVWNDQYALDVSGNHLESNTSHTRGLNGYRDIPGRDYIQLPNDAGIVGIARNSTGDPVLITPPFAVRFNEHGVVVASPIQDDAHPDMVFYDANHDGRFDIDNSYTANGARRSNPYNPASINLLYSSNPYTPDYWDPRSPLYNRADATIYDSSQLRHKLPFERLEAVVAVLIFSMSDFESARYAQRDVNGKLIAYIPITNMNLIATIGDVHGDLRGSSTVNDDGNATTPNDYDSPKDWLLGDSNTSDQKLDNAQMLFFSRYSGTTVRQ